MSAGFDFERACAVLVTELRAIVRDRRAFLTAVVLPILLYPVLFVLMDKMEDSSEKRLAKKQHTVALALEELDDESAARLREALAHEDLNLALVPAEAEALAAIKAAESGAKPTAEAVLDGDPVALVLARAPEEGQALPALTVYVENGKTDSNVAGDRVRAAARELVRTIEREVIVATLGLDPAERVATKAVDLAPPEDSAGHQLGKLLPLIAVLVLVSSASFAALSAFAGEREAGTLETLLVQPVPGVTIAAGKMAAVALVGFLALAGNAVSFLGSTAAGLGNMPGFSGDALGAGAARVGLGLLLVFPTALLLCGATALVSARARSFREGQNMIVPLTLVAAALAGPVAVDRVALDPLLALVPVTGGALAFRDALSGGLTLIPALLAFLASSAWAALVVRRVGGLLDAERLLRDRDVSGEVAARRIQSRRALAWGAVSVLLVYVAGGWMQSLSLKVGLVLTLWGLALGLAFLIVRGTARRANEPVARALWLGLPRPAHALGALMVAPALAHGVAWFASKQSEFLPIPQMDGQLFESLTEMSIWGRVLLFAVSPGICEELLFRGAILSGLRRDLPPAKSIAWQALLFGAVHASIFRFLPTAFVGAVLTALTLRARSTWPAILLHSAYNCILVGGVLEDPPVWLGPLPAVVIGLMGVGLLSTGRHSAKRGEEAS